MPKNKLLDIITEPKLTTTERILLLYISIYIEDTQKLCNLTNAEFKEAYNVSITSISKTLNSIAKKGFIEIKYNDERVRFISISGDDRFNVDNLMTLDDLHMTSKKTPTLGEVADGYIYILKSDFGYKIGKSKTLKNRLQLFSVKLPFEFEVEGFYKVSDMSAVEIHFHRKYADKRLEGEWFDLNKEELKELKAELLNLNIYE